MSSLGSRQVVTACFLFSSGCGGGNEVPPDDIVCTPNAVPGISIRVSDAPSGNAAACGANATVTSAGFSEVDQVPGTGTPTCIDSTPIAAVFERPGTYSVVVSKAGYQDFRADNIVVTKGVCHVNTVTLDARLSP